MTKKADYDTPWKKIFDRYFKEFMEYCWPDKCQEVDWSKGYKMMDKEMNKITRNAKHGNRVMDKLVEIHLKDNHASLIMLHCEIQGRKEVNYEERMYFYNVRAHDTHRVPVASIAILIDPNKKWRPGRYRRAFWGTSIEMHFPIIKLIDYQSRIPLLEASKNPFAMVILAQLMALDKNVESKLSSKIRLTRLLYKKGFKKEEILELYHFLDWIIQLPDELESDYNEAVEEIEKEHKVEYITTAERIGIRKGSREILERLLMWKFKKIPNSFTEKLEKGTRENMLKWTDRALTSNRIDEVFLD